METLEVSGRGIYRVEEADLVHFTKLRYASPPVPPPQLRCGAMVKR